VERCSTKCTGTAFRRTWAARHGEIHGALFSFPRTFRFVVKKLNFVLPSKDLLLRVKSRFLRWFFRANFNCMSTLELRHSISSLLEQTDDAELMQSILILLRKSLTLPAPGIAAFEADGTPITEDELVASILEGSREVRAGKKIALADLKKELLAE